jgi:hypothetical protein
MGWPGISRMRTNVNHKRLLFGLGCVDRRNQSMGLSVPTSLVACGSANFSKPLLFVSIFSSQHSDSRLISTPRLNYLRTYPAVNALSHRIPNLYRHYRHKGRDGEKLLLSFHHRAFHHIVTVSQARAQGILLRTRRRVRETPFRTRFGGEDIFKDRDHELDAGFHAPPSSSPCRKAPDRQAHPHARNPRDGSR